MTDLFSKPSRLTDVELARRVLAGQTDEQIAEAFGYRVTTVKRRRQLHGLLTAPSPDDRAIIRREKTEPPSPVTPPPSMSSYDLTAYQFCPYCQRQVNRAQVGACRVKGCRMPERMGLR